MFGRLMAGAKDYAERCRVVFEDNIRLREELSEARALNQRLQEQNEWLQGDLTAEGDEQTLRKQLTEARAFTLKLQEQIRFLQEGIKDERNRNLASEQSLRERIAALTLQNSRLEA
jgi:DNA anti-recombination protein RmuC